MSSEVDNSVNLLFSADRRYLSHKSSRGPCRLIAASCLLAWRGLCQNYRLAGANYIGMSQGREVGAVAAC